MIQDIQCLSSDADTAFWGKILNCGESVNSGTEM